MPPSGYAFSFTSVNLEDSLAVSREVWLSPKLEGLAQLSLIFSGLAVGFSQPENFSGLTADIG